MKERKTVGACLRFAALALKENPEVLNPALEAQSLLSYISGLTREKLLTRPENPLPKKTTERYAVAVAERVHGKPLAYITRRVEFYGRTFYVDKRVLIPRPETEFLVSAALRNLPENEALCVVDVGTGSGCIALSLCCERPAWKVFAADSSRDALAVARRNFDVYHAKITLLASHLLDGFAKAERFHAVLVNPPYLSTRQRDTLPASVKNFEPAEALFAGEKGTEVIEALLPQAHARLKKGGFFMCEISPDIRDATLALLEKNAFSLQDIAQDYAGWDRVLVAQKAE